MTNAESAERDRLLQQAALQEQRRAAIRLRQSKLAHDDLIDFSRLMMPDPQDPNDAEVSKYEATYFHRALAAALETVDRGETRRLIITFPPRHGKTKLAGHMFPAWFVGRDSYRNVAVCTYNQPFADDYGRSVRKIMQSPAYKQVFPDCTLAKGSAAADRLKTEEDGALFFVGRGGTITGRGADLIIIDDPIKNSQEANSVTIREELWTWYQNDIKSRFMSDTGVMIIIQCMTGDTPVLMGNGTERELKDIRVGDGIATYKDGKLSTSVVKNWASNGVDFVYVIKTTSGKIVRANGRHPFLVSDNGKLKWIRTKDLRLGHEMLLVNGESGKTKSVAQTVATPPSYAEGTASHTTTRSDGQTVFGLHLSTRLRGVLHILSTATASLWLNTLKCLRSKTASVQSANGRQAKTSVPIGAASYASIIATIARKSGHFCATTAIWLLGMQRHPKLPAQRPNISDFILDEIVEISEGGYEEVFDIQVDETENFIANGLVSHNTRWHEDDLVGRITDPTNPHFDEEEADQWKIINIPAIAGEGDVLGRKPGEALWPEKFGIAYLESFKRTNAKGFSALYQQEPTPQDGDFFKADMVIKYRSEDTPPIDQLRIYAASDHAVGIRQENDRTCLLIIGVDQRDVIWVLDVWWKRAKTDATVEAMIGLMKKWKPLIWWAEQGHISQSIGPFLYKQMMKEKVFTYIKEQAASKDKLSRAQSIQGRMSMGMVKFPGFEPWYEQARAELLKFPQARHDDFVDAIAHIGMGLEKMLTGKTDVEKPSGPRVGSLAWVKRDAHFRDKQSRIIKNRRGM